MIFNAKDRPLGSTGFLPNMRSTLTQWLRPITATRITKVIEDFEVVESVVNFTFRGVVLPGNAEKLKMKPEIQRGWKWSELWTTADISLQLDDQFVIDGRQFRVMGLRDYDQAGYYYYEVVEDYQEDASDGSE